MIGIKIGIITSLLSVVIGAFGAHGLKDILSQNNSEAIFQTAVRYQIFHSIALILAGILLQLSFIESKLPIHLFLSGIIIFSGSLYILSITGIKWLGAITPIGGVLLILGWCFLFISLKNPS